MTRIWNWKAALASGCYRAPVFVIASWRTDRAAAIQAGIAEFLLFCCLSGLTGATVQRLRHLQPEWLARALILGAIPVCAHLCEWMLHAAVATPARRSGILISLGLSVISEAFTWHVMRQGAMLTGAGGASLSSDLRRMSALLWGFVVAFARR